MLQIIFITIEGTFLEPNLNHAGHFVTKHMEEKRLWFTLYDNPIFKYKSSALQRKIV